MAKEGQIKIGVVLSYAQIFLSIITYLLVQVKGFPCFLQRLVEIYQFSGTGHQLRKERRFPRRTGVDLQNR